MLDQSLLIGAEDLSKSRQTASLESKKRQKVFLLTLFSFHVIDHRHFSLLFALFRPSHVLFYQHREILLYHQRTYLLQHSHRIVLVYYLGLLRRHIKDGGCDPVKRINDVVHRCHVLQGTPVSYPYPVLVQLNVFESMKPVFDFPSHFDRFRNLVVIRQRGYERHLFSRPSVSCLSFVGDHSDNRFCSGPFRRYFPVL